ncbi:OstA-like protein [Salinimicrobium catena]|uniref:OstA-like protein n=1 Tax=Salinimicrobium catena TaxID=390640 RepID=A0A1H5P904_9FLAO|nr:OstA-like protein [Salinimicrobium catena]SDL73871.1 OstA-like protein [Salinimicrobium catena]SEF10442.1 OstA-like protein [Salinimicrobium catena]
MRKVRFLILFICLFAWGFPSFGQTTKKIEYESDRTIKNEEKYPGALILSKVQDQVHFTHEGIEVWCDQAIHYAQENFFKAYGNVRMEQGDTISMTSKYAEYNGTTQFAFASGNVNMRNPQTSLQTDTLFFDRQKQQAYYRSGGTVRDSASVLKSRIGRYYLNDEKYSFASEVVITNPEYVLTSSQLDFYSETGHAYMYGPSTITSEESVIYAERGFYDTRGDTGYFVKNSRIDYKNRILEGDSLYFNRNTNFASATNNIKVTDTINKSVIRGHYAEVFREKDSVFITKRAVAIALQEKDSVYIHSDTLMVTGKIDNRIIRGFYDVRLYKSNMSGKSDSIHVRESTGLTQMLGNPVIWSGENQLTGDTIHLINKPNSEELDSLKVFDNAFMIQKDSIGGYNQIKGKEMYGLFADNELYEVNLIKNTETLYYMRNDPGELIGINKTLSSSIQILLEDQEVQEIYYLKQIDGTLYPEQDLPPNARELKGFNWRGDEKLNSVDDLFAGEPPYDLVKIKGIPLPEEDEEFFEERTDGEAPLLNEKSRLRPEDLQERAQDTLPRAQHDSLRQVIEKPRDTTRTGSDSIPAEFRELQDTINSNTVKDTLSKKQDSPSRREELLTKQQ